MSTGALILIVEDEPQMRRFLRAALSAQGFRWVEAATAVEARIAATTQNPELVLLDLGLPDADGLTLLRELREWSQAPAIVLSARGREEDKVEALDAGANDYLTKPFGVNELLARIRVALRQSQKSDAQPVITFGDIAIDLTRRLVTRGESEVHLTPTEYRLLTLLARNLGKVLTHRQILKEVWGPNHENQAHSVRVCMGELRKKLENEPARPRWLVTEPGVGYRLRD